MCVHDWLADLRKLNDRQVAMDNELKESRNAQSAEICSHGLLWNLTQLARSGSKDCRLVRVVPGFFVT